MNATTEVMKNRLPTKDFLTPGDIASAMGLATTAPILQAIKDGRIAASQFQDDGKFVVARVEAERFIDSTSYIPKEGRVK